MAESRMVREFLGRIWGRDKAFVDLPSIVRVKGEARWIPYTMEWPSPEEATRRIARCVDDEEDVYFSPCMFLYGERKAEYALPTRWLWADVDELPVEKQIKLHHIMPTITVRTSRGRYQALWECRQSMTPHIQQLVNQALTRKIGADPGGWDITQVLRMPGTYNFKYSVNGAKGSEVYLEYADGAVYDVRELLRLLGLTVKDLRPSVSSSTQWVGVGEGEAHDAARRETVGGSAVGARRLPRRARTLLKAPVVEGERSEVLFKVWQLLARHGATEAQAVAAAIDSPLNKWKGDGDGGAARLGQDYRRAAAKGNRGRSERASVRDDGPDGEGDIVARDSGGSENGSRSGWEWEDYDTFIKAKFPRPRWLVEDIWQASSYGVIAGAPKTSKSTMALCMAVAVASGRPMFHRYEVPKAGPVLIMQEENSAAVMQDRLIKIASSMGLLKGEQRKSRLKGSIGEKYVTNIDFSGVPIELLNRPGFSLRKEEHLEALQSKIIEAQPLLVIIDPLYRMLDGADESMMSQITPILNNLTQLSDRWGCAIIAIHHFRKAKDINTNGDLYAADVAQEMVGSVAIHGWYDCGIFLRKTDYDGRVLRLRMDRDFRADAPKPALEIAMEMGAPGDLKFLTRVRDYDVEGLVARVVEQNGGKVPLHKLADELEMDKRTVLKIVRGSETMEDKRWGNGTRVQLA